MDLLNEQERERFRSLQTKQDNRFALDDSERNEYAGLAAEDRGT